MFAIALLAAGASSRMGGGDKLLELVDDTPLLRRQSMRALAVCPDVFVTLPLEAPDRRQALKGLKVRIVDVPDAISGMSASFRALVQVSDELSGVMVVPSDMPDIDECDLRVILDQFKLDVDRVVRGGTQDGKPGHPVMFPRRLFPSLAILRGDLGAKNVLKHEVELLVPLPARHALTDLDTPEDWARWRAEKLKRPAAD